MQNKQSKSTGCVICNLYYRKGWVSKYPLGDFPGVAVKTLCSQCRGPGFNHGQGTRPHMHAATKSSHATTKEPSCHN